MTSSHDNIVCKIKLNGIVCDQCPSRIEKLLYKFNGVNQVILKLSHDNKKAKIFILYDGLSKHVGPRAFLKILNHAGILLYIR